MPRGLSVYPPYVTALSPILRELVYVVAIAIGANIDNLGAGFAYALSKRRIAFSANAIIAAFSP